MNEKKEKFIVRSFENRFDYEVLFEKDGVFCKDENILSFDKKLTPAQMKKKENEISESKGGVDVVVRYVGAGLVKYRMPVEEFIKNSEKVEE